MLFTIQLYLCEHSAIESTFAIEQKALPKAINSEIAKPNFSRFG